MLYKNGGNFAPNSLGGEAEGAVSKWSEGVEKVWQQAIGKH